MYKPILFNTKMIKAILDGRKTQTRRVIKPQPRIIFRDNKDRYPMAFYKDNSMWVKPPCQPGDVLWVRETWTVSDVGEYRDNDGHFSDTVDFSYKADNSLICKPVSSELADKMFELLERLEASGDGGDNWRPSIHMPREAARIFLKVKDVRVERLQDITEEDALAEGIKKYSLPNMLLNPSGLYVYGDDSKDTAKEAFLTYWDEITYKSDKTRFKTSEYYSKYNPWVLVIEFERCDKDGKV